MCVKVCRWLSKVCVVNHVHSVTSGFFLSHTHNHLKLTALEVNEATDSSSSLSALLLQSEIRALLHIRVHVYPGLQRQLTNNKGSSKTFRYPIKKFR